MPATAQTWRDMKRLHRIFAVSSLLLLAATVWLLLDDHRRPWKTYQRTSQEIELRLAEWQKYQVETNNQAELQRLEAELQQRRSTYFSWEHGFPLPGKKFLELPILDAFNSPLKIENLWSEGLTQDFNFREVRRFDRCTTCHQELARTWPGTPTEPVIASEQWLTAVLSPLASAEAVSHRSGAEGPSTDLASETALSRQVETALGLGLAAGLLQASDITICYVRDNSAAAQAKLTANSGLAAEDPLSADEIHRRLLASASPSRETRLAPGLLPGDVLVACDDQPLQSPEQALTRLQDAFQQAQRLQVEGKQANVKPLTLTIRRGLPQPYAGHPRLDLFVGPSSPHPMAEFGCTICHAGQGSATDFQWASHTPNGERQRQAWRHAHGWSDNPHWEYPMVAQRFAESACLKCHHRVVELLPSERFPNPPAPQLVRGYHLIQTYGCFGCHEINGFQGDKSIGPDLRAESVGTEISDRSGTLRRVGPSLRHVGQKLTRAFLEDSIADPQHFRPGTRMPRFFGTWNHLADTSRQVAQDYEPLEIRAVAAYLWERSQPIDHLRSPRGITDSASAEKAARGKTLFQTRGCLACHDHADFPDAAALRDPQALVAGPELSNLGAKFTEDSSRRWLSTWLRDPSRCSPRTLMPDLRLTPVPHKDADGRVVAVTDPVDDLVEYLLRATSDAFQPAELASLDAEKLAALVREHLRTTFPESQADLYAKQGIPAVLRATLRPPEQESLLAADSAAQEPEPLSDTQRLRYLGHKTILKLGCYACHDIPGFETAKPIGPALSDWGRKDPSQLAFEEIAAYLQQPDETVGPSFKPFEHPSADYLRQILSGNRVGFLYQKLTEPRSYDFRTTESKRYNDRLRMPRFHFDVAAREAVMTCVLGLVGQPPTEKYLYKPTPRRQAMLAAEPLLQRYHCSACHVLQPERWHVAAAPGSFPDQPRAPGFPFTTVPPSTAALQASLRVDRSGQRHATLAGAPMLDRNGQPLVLDEAGDELTEEDAFVPSRLEYVFQPWQPAAVEGHDYQVGVTPLSIAATRIASTYPARGGFLARYLLPRVVALEKAANPSVKGSEAWGWVPPPLIGEGAKVQTAWLHSYLLDPQPVRPAAFLRMPKYNLSSDEARKLAEYFAAVDGAEYPYDASSSHSTARLDQAELRYQELLEQLATPDHPLQGTRFDHAMQVVTNKNFCISCHVVGAFEPQTSDRAKGPDLSQVHRRLRADYVRRWIGRPMSLLPYTSMPSYFPYLPDIIHLGGIDQSLYHGTSVEQVDGLVDLLLHFDRYAKSRHPIAPTTTEADK